MYKDAEHAREVRTTGSSVARSCRLRGAYCADSAQNQYFSKEDESALRKLLLKVKKQADAGAIFCLGEAAAARGGIALTPRAQLRRRCRTRSAELLTQSWASTSLRRPTSTVRRASALCGSSSCLFPCRSADQVAPRARPLSRAPHIPCSSVPRSVAPGVSRVSVSQSNPKHARLDDIRTNELLVIDHSARASSSFSTPPRACTAPRRRRLRRPAAR